MIRLVVEGSKLVYNTANDHDQSVGLPEWFDGSQINRGQQYFIENRVAMLSAKMNGLITLMSLPYGLNILSHTGRSSTGKTAGARYSSTTMRVLSWYEGDVEPGSRCV